jgi:hypothetical protein
MMKCLYLMMNRYLYPNAKMLYRLSLNDHHKGQIF